MKLLFRLKYFETKEEVENYFKNTLPTRDKNYFFNVNKLKQIEQNETIYFSFLGYIVATATFMGEIKIDRERNEKFIFGHKLSNVKILNSNIKIDAKLFGTNTTYLNSIEKLDEIEKII